MNRIHPLISPEDAVILANLPDIVIVDARGGADAKERYLKAHLANAVHVNLETDLSDPGPDAARGGRHPLPAPQKFGTLLGTIGITPATHVLVYDDKAGANAAARFWWMMRSLGHEKVQVIDGGLSALVETGALITSGPAAPVQVPPYPSTEWKLPLANIAETDLLSQDDKGLVIDVRENYRYRGESEPIDLVAGHIPGAINLPYMDNLEANGRFKSPKVLESLFAPVLRDKQSKDVIVHCGSGVTACHTILAMEVGGFPTPRLYVGSWSEWSRNQKPINQTDQR